MILFQGVPEKWQPTLQAGLSLTEERCDTPHWRIRYLFEKADGELHHQLRAFGHYQPKIEKILRFDDGCWKAIFKIELGPRIKIARAEIKLFGQAAHDPSFQEFLTRNALRVGQPLHHGRYERFKRNLLALAEARGYFKARFLRHELRVDPERQRAEIVLHFE
ncbi:TPA: outer membrane protein assembly factor, partial [Candidatus Micrarchaeota archaeon]|nr:outer membrane protein assembly factor [Candidatus Micrarchaeota archaeon]